VLDLRREEGDTGDRVSGLRVVVIDRLREGDLRVRGETRLPRCEGLAEVPRVLLVLRGAGRVDNRAQLREPVADLVLAGIGRALELLAEGADLVLVAEARVHVLAESVALLIGEGGEGVRLALLAGLLHEDAESVRLHPAVPGEAHLLRLRAEGVEGGEVAHCVSPSVRPPSGGSWENLTTDLVRRLVGR
jgi:hypothetical protein